MPGEQCTYKDAKVSCGCDRFRCPENPKGCPGKPDPNFKPILLHPGNCLVCKHPYIYHK